MDNNTKPFLWNFVKSIPVSKTETGGEEGLTESANEENKCSIVEFSFEK